ncbi:TetR family transcriptional regulator C-terminal domain-containing protein [Arthrobacter sp. ATA002]|uniref:TetR/AcrR family transcriptional regulator n=1 Tax=Arthrobacter sp. ATA002 TaxID=2991715 RepID=UPI0022A7E688|nr:TetR family transcriptional regulator C-terminal domain-containing protein [Arthrobacter sp. ATA002]WAP50579.1 TetR family transcriptional regulator C-terminal domain-containing protein [Arthrobacter sp. ATA002]
MPKIVDHDARRREIVDAIIRRIETAGFGSVSVRNVAGDLNVSPSAVRHYFPSSEEMLAFTLRTMRESQAARLPPPLKDWDVRQAWLEALPLDDLRRREAAVWLSAMTASKSPVVQAVLDEVNADLDHLCTVTVAQLGCRESTATESKALRAFTDGLTLNAVADPQAFDSEAITVALDSYLGRLRQDFAQDATRSGA